jgi:membrane protein implicated in regulation of membrane protease activity
MSIGVGIFLMVVGAVLAFAVKDSWDAVNLQVVGYILMLAGLTGIALSFYITNRRRRVETDAIDPAVEEEYRVVEEHHRDIKE